MSVKLRDLKPGIIVEFYQPDDAPYGEIVHVADRIVEIRKNESSEGGYFIAITVLALLDQNTDPDIIVGEPYSLDADRYLSAIRKILTKEEFLILQL